MLCAVPCLPFVGEEQKNLITTYYQNWKDAKSDLAAHAGFQYHRDSKARMDVFIEMMMKNPGRTVENQLSSIQETQIKKNRQFLISIIKCLEFCGRQGIGIRGHRDDSTSDSLNQGNFKALLNFRTDAGDSHLGEHLETCARNATYISKTSQKELFLCMEKYIQGKIVKEIKSGGGFYGIEADEVTDTSNWEQIGLVVRYIHNEKPTEKLIEYIECESCTGKCISEKIIATLLKLELDPKLCRAQTYDGAENMAGRQNGCAKKIQEVSSRA